MTRPDRIIGPADFSSPAYPLPNPHGDLRAAPSQSPDTGAGKSGNHSFAVDPRLIDQLREQRRMRELEGFHEWDAENQLVAEAEAAERVANSIAWAVVLTVIGVCVGLAATLLWPDHFATFLGWL